MKTRYLCATTLIAALGLSLISGATANATETIDSSVDAKGNVTIIQGEAGGGEDTKDPEDPIEPIVPDPGEVTTNPDKGTLIIQAVSNLNFGPISTGTTTQTEYARAVSLKDADGDAPRGAYVQWSDLRDTERSYSLTAELETQFTKDGGTEKLTGSTIDYTNGIMNSEQDKTIWPEKEMKSSFQLTETGGSEKVVTTGTVEPDTLTGKGEYFVEYGQSDSWDAAAHVGANKGLAGSADESVQLTIPQKTVATMTTGDYEAVVTWTLSVTP